MFLPICYLLWYMPWHIRLLWWQNYQERLFRNEGYAYFFQKVVWKISSLLYLHCLYFCPVCPTERETNNLTTKVSAWRAIPAFSKRADILLITVPIRHLCDVSASVSASQRSIFSPVEYNCTQGQGAPISFLHIPIRDVQSLFFLKRDMLLPSTPVISTV